MSPRALLLLAPLCLSCAEPALRPSRAAVPIKSACTADSRPASSAGIEVRKGRRHSDARTLFVKNLGDRPRTVRIQQVSRVEGPCDGDWARQTPLGFIDVETQSPPEEVTLLPGQEIRIQTGSQRVSGTWACAKLGLALWMKVDDTVVCADGGAWIAERDSEE